MTSEWEKVESSHIQAIRTDGNDLLVQFKNGDIYAYPGLSAEFDNLVGAESVGRYFHKHIRHEEYRKLSREDFPTF